MKDHTKVPLSFLKYDTQQANKEIYVLERSMYLKYPLKNCSFLSGGTKIEAVRGGQQEERPLSTPQGSRVAQWAWGTMQHKHKNPKTTHPTRKGAPPSYVCELGHQRSFLVANQYKITIYINQKTHTLSTNTHNIWYYVWRRLA